MKMIKKLTISIIVLVLAFFLVFSVNVNAGEVQTSDLIQVKGAGVRTSGNEGIRFEAKIDNTFTGTISEYHILIAYGKVADPSTIVIGATVNEQVVLDGEDEAGLVEGSYFITLFDIPTEYYGNDVTARAYVVLDNEDVVYATTATTRNLIDTARTAYSKSTTYDEGENLVKELAESHKIKVANGNSVVYKNAISEIDVAANDTIDFIKGEYTGELTIDQNNVNVFGVYAGILTTSSTRKTEYETVFKNKVVVGDGVENAIVSGISFNSNMALALNGNNSKVTFKYNKVKYSDNAAIREYSATGTTTGVSSTSHSDINILKNAFDGTNDTYSRAIFLQGNIGNINIESNIFEAKAKEAIAENEISIKINKFTTGAIVNIMANKFQQKSCNYLVDLAGSHSTENFLNAYINIEDNAGLGYSDGNEFMGNGFRVTYVGSSTTINFIHNEQMRFSRYYNTILFSEKDCTGSSGLGTTTENPTINIKYNKLYGDKEGRIDKGSRTSTLSTNYINLGLGFGSSSSNITIEGNFFSGSERGYSFTKNSSASASKNVYGAGAITDSDEATKAATADSSYDTSVAIINAFYVGMKAYNDSLELLQPGVNAYYGGTGDANITKYLPTFDGTIYGGKLEIQDSKLVYVGSDLIEKMTALRISVYRVSAQPC